MLQCVELYLQCEIELQADMTMYAGVTTVQIQLLLYKVAPATWTMTTRVRLTAIRHHSVTKTFYVFRNVNPVAWLLWYIVVVEQTIQTV